MSDTTARGMTPEELKEARQNIDAMLMGPPEPKADVNHAGAWLIARYCRELERHAEAMADADSCAEFETAIADYRTFTTPEPRRT